MKLLPPPWLPSLTPFSVKSSSPVTMNTIMTGWSSVQRGWSIPREWEMSGEEASEQVLLYPWWVKDKMIQSHHHHLLFVIVTELEKDRERRKEVKDRKWRGVCEEVLLQRLFFFLTIFSLIHFRAERQTRQVFTGWGLKGGMVHSVCAHPVKHQLLM